nr:amino acid ABC transporter ATP-binding protein [Streptococcus thermophilus]
MGNTVISLNNVTKDFGGGVLGLDDVTLDVHEGEITVLLGLSGSGKSTLLRHLNGLHTPTSGEVNVLGKDLSALKSKEMRAVRKDIGVIFQHFNLIGPMSVLENVCTGRLGSLDGPRLSLMMYPKDVRLEAIEQLERVGLGDRAFQRADTLSGGQQQRVAIARALMQHPKVLLADEPVASLDPVSSQGVMELLTEISREEKLTVVCSLHQVQLAVDFGDRIVGLRSGQVVLDRETSSMTVEDANSIYSAVAGAEDDASTEMTA